MFYRTYKLMMDWFSTVSSRKKSATESAPGTQGMAEFIGRHRARRALLSQSDRMLADLGFSRDLLEEGVKAWPWLVATETTSEFAPGVSPVAVGSHRSTTVETEHHAMDEQRYAA